MGFPKLHYNDFIIYIFKNKLKTNNVLRFQIKVECMIKMTSATVKTICFEDEIPVILNASLELETYIKWTPELGENLNVLMEPDNRVGKFAVCVEKDDRVVGHLKKGDSGKFTKTIFYYLRSDTYCNCYADV